MSIEANCAHYVHKDDKTFNFYFEANTDTRIDTGGIHWDPVSVKITRVEIEYSGKNINNKVVKDSKTFYPNKSWFQYTWVVNSGMLPSKEGSATITAYNSIGEKATYTTNWGKDYNLPHLHVWGKPVIGSNGCIELWAYGNSDRPMTYVEFDWMGKTRAGIPICDKEFINGPNSKAPEASLSTICSPFFPGRATVTMSNGYITRSYEFLWPVLEFEKPEPEPETVLTIKDLYIDKNKTTGMKNGLYVVGTKLAIAANVDSSNGLKKARMILTGAKNSDNEWNQCSSTIEATTTATEVGEINIQLIVTDKKGNTTEKTLTVKIDGDDDKKYFAYYFFGSDMHNSLNRNDLSDASIKLYNKYNEDNKQVDPAGLTFTLYGHYYETYSQCKDVNQDISNLLEIKTFKAPNNTKSDHIVIPLTSTDIAKLKNCKGVAFGIVEQKKLTIHGAQCSIDVEYKS